MGERRHAGAAGRAERFQLKHRCAGDSRGTMMFPPCRRCQFEEEPMNTTSANLSSEMESDVSKAISGAEDMLAQAANSTGEKAAELRGRALEQLKALRSRMHEAQAAALRQSKA